MEIGFDSDRVRSKYSGLRRAWRAASVRSSCWRSQAGIDVGGVMPAARRPAELGAVGRFALAEQQVVRFALDYLAVLEAECFRARAPPAAWRLSPALAGLEVITGRVLRRAAVDLAPDVVQVIAPAQGRDNRQADLYPRSPEAAELTMIISWCMGVTRLRIMSQWPTGDQDQERSSAL